MKRKAVAEEEGTLVLAVGGEPGVPYESRRGSTYFAAMPAFRAERWDEAIALIEAGPRASIPGNPSILYNLACAESRAGRPLDALTHLQEAVRARPEVRATGARRTPTSTRSAREPGFPG